MGGFGTPGCRPVQHMYLENYQLRNENLNLPLASFFVISQPAVEI